MKWKLNRLPLDLNVRGTHRTVIGHLTWMHGCDEIRVRAGDRARRHRRWSIRLHRDNVCL